MVNAGRISRLYPLYGKRVSLGQYALCTLITVTPIFVFKKHSLTLGSEMMSMPSFLKLLTMSVSFAPTAVTS